MSKVKHVLYLFLKKVHRSMFLAKFYRVFCYVTLDPNGRKNGTETSYAIGQQYVICLRLWLLTINHIAGLGYSVFNLR